MSRKQVPKIDPTDVAMAQFTRGNASFINFDSTGTYIIRAPLPLYAWDMGPWPDLEPERFDSLGGLIFADGAVRELLHRFRVTKQVWTEATQQDRQSIKAALEHVFALHQTIQMLLDPTSSNVTKGKARKLVASVARAAKKARAQKRGPQKEADRQFYAPIAKAAFVATRRLLAEAKAESRKASTERSARSLTDVSTEINNCLRRIKQDPVCTPADAARAPRSRNSRELTAIALEIVRRALPILSADDIRRGHPRQR